MRRMDCEARSVGPIESELLWTLFENATTSTIDRYVRSHTLREAARTRRALEVEALHSAAEQRQRFLAESSRVLAESLDYEQTLKTVARLAVPGIADWCTVDLLRENGTIGRVATEHRDPHRSELTQALHRNPPKNDSTTGAPNVIRTGRTEYVSQMSDLLLQTREHDPERLRILRSLGLTSMICAPLIARDRMLGAITLSTETGRDLTPEDVRMVEDLAQRAAVSIDNARLLDETQRALRGRDEVLAIVTHDIRSPLSVVMTGAALLLVNDAELANGERIRHRAETIQRSARHIARLINDLTDISHIDAGRLTIERKPEDPASVVCDAVETLQAVMAQRGSAVRCNVNGQLPLVECDRDRIVQVIGNLVANASKVGAPSIVVRVEAQESEVIVSVTDTGPGIAPEDLPHMFNRYWRGRDAKYKGTGLGLPIAHGIVKAHGGRMWIESAVGIGSTFSFTLPSVRAFSSE
jgi:signal transduction histidine kinase